MSSHGGKRSGAGRKLPAGEIKKSVRLSVPASKIEAVQKYLDGDDKALETLSERLVKLERLIITEFGNLRSLINLQSKNVQIEQGMPADWGDGQNIDDYDNVVFDDDYIESDTIDDYEVLPNPKDNAIVDVVDGIEHRSEFKKAIQLLDDGQNVFITGRAGTGKSTLLKYWRENTCKNVVVLAPTGIAALNAGGQTIHSFCKFPPRIFYPENIKGASEPKKIKVLEQLDAIIIDEVSMVSALMLDGINQFLKKSLDPLKIWGGVQMIFVGDLFQLPPVITRHDDKFYSSMYKSPYFFSAQAKADFAIVELTKIYRQSDVQFIQTLNNIRLGKATQSDIKLLNSRVMPMNDDNEFCVTLAPTNAAVSTINQAKLNDLDGEKFIYEAEIKGNFKEKDCPADPHLELKVGAQIIMVSNNGKKWVNGSVGEITALKHLPDGDIDNGDDDSTFITVLLDNGLEVDVGRDTWEMNEYNFDSKIKKLDFNQVGSCTQFPIKLAWAITCHKSQGLTLKKMNVDIGRGFFAHGQAYVTFSRAATLEGLHLSKPITVYDLNKNIDSRVKAFLKQSE